MWKLLNRSDVNVHNIALLLGSVSIVGYLIAFLRDRAFPHYFGAGELLDVYVASFRIPDLLFITATAFFSIFALLPICEEKQKEGSAVFTEFINTVWFVLLLCLLIGGTILFFLIPTLAETFFGRFTGELQDTFILASRVFILQAILFAITSFLTALLQIKRKFLVYALLPLLYNLGIITGVMLLYPVLGMAGLLLGVLLGVAAGVLLQSYVLIRNGLFPRLAPTKHMLSEVWRSIKISVPRASALLSGTIAQIIIFGVVVGITSGALSVYYFADNLKAIPLVIIGTAYSVASFPLLVEHFTRGDLKGVRDIIEQAFCRLFFFILPLIALVFVLRGPLVELVFQTGEFTAETAIITGSIVGIFVFSALSSSVLAFCARALYACGRSLLPFLVFATLAVVEVFAVKGVVYFLELHREPLTLLLEVTGITSGGFGILFAVVTTIVIAESVAALVLFLLLAWVVRQKVGAILCSLGKNLTVAILLGIAIALLQWYFFSEVAYNTLEGIAVLGLLGGVSVVVWYLLLRIVKVKEREVLHQMLHKIQKKVWS